MPEDLPIYSNPMLRTGLQFAALDRLKGADMRAAWEKAERCISRMEGAPGVAPALAVVQQGAVVDAVAGWSREDLLRLHGLLFAGRPGAGAFRSLALDPRYRGQDCAPPEFIARSIDNFAAWMGAESFGEIHPIERCVLAMTRIVDIWPFEFGNFTVAVVLGNRFLNDAGMAPFFVQPEHMQEFEGAVVRAMAIETQPLVNAVYNTVKTEMEALARS